MLSGHTATLAMTCSASHVCRPFIQDLPNDGAVPTAVLAGRTDTMLTVGLAIDAAAALPTASRNLAVACWASTALYTAGQTLSGDAAAAGRRALKLA